MANSSSFKDLHRFFRGKFTKEKYFQVFYWAEPVLDFDKSESLGQWFLQNIFVNLAVQAKFHHDTLHASDKVKERPASRQYLLDYFDRMAGSTKYGMINHNCFAEVPEGMRDSMIKAKKQRRVVDMEEGIEVSEPLPHVSQPGPAF
jgi:hypothetical protein